MNLSPDSGSPQPLDNDVVLQHRRLRMLTHATALSVLILTGTMFIFLYRQVVLVRRQTAELGRYLAEVERSGMPSFMEQVRDRFNEFRKENPDFNPIYTRYFGTNEPVARNRVTPLPAGSTNSAGTSPP